MATKLIAPRPGEGVEELTVVAWLKQVGDHVDEFESVVELETDKVVTEFPSPIAGTLLRIDVAAGEAVRWARAWAWSANQANHSKTTRKRPHRLHKLKLLR